MAWTTRFDAEKPAVIENNRPPENWPVQGAVSVHDLVVRLFHVTLLQ